MEMPASMPLMYLKIPASGSGIEPRENGVILATKTEFDCVICNNDEMAVGAIKAMTNAGLNPRQTIPVVGIDVTPVALKAMERGQLSYRVPKSPQSASTVCERPLLANGETIGTVVHIPFEPVTANYKDYMRRSVIRWDPVML